MAHQPRKRFGQNFLHDHNIINRILSSIQFFPGQHWVEIGPGQGALTKPLLASGVKLDIIELDRDLVRYLREKFGYNEKLTIHSGDAQKFHYENLVNAGGKLQIIGNLPYNISTPLLFHLLETAHCIQDMYFMLQKEVVDRICAEPGSKQYGKLTIMLRYHCSAELLFYVPPESFNPPPKVISAVVRLSPHHSPPNTVSSIADLNLIVTQAFSQRRKTLRNSLKTLFSEQEIIELSIDPTLRPESITRQQYANLSNFLTQKNNDRNG